MHTWVGSSAHWVYTNLAAVFSWVLDSTSLWLTDLLSTNLFQCILKRCCSYHLRSIIIIFKLNADVFVLLDPWFLWTVNYEELGFLSPSCAVAHNFYNGIFKSSVFSFFTFLPLMLCDVFTVCFILYSSFLKIKELRDTFICLVLSYCNVERFKWNSYYSS